MKTVIASVKFKVGKKEIDLTPDEARELFAQLTTLFARISEPVPVPYLVPVYPQPILWDPQPFPASQPYTITCTSCGPASFLSIARETSDAPHPNISPS